MEDLEEVYKREIEEADKYFLESKKNKLEGDLEAQYKEKLKLIREKYKKDLLYALESSKNKKQKKSKGKMPEKISPYKVLPLDMSTSRLERIRQKLTIFKFIFNLRLKNFITAVTPDSFLIFTLKTKITIKRIWTNASEAIRRSMNNSINNTIKTKETLASYLIKAYSKSKEIFSVTLKKISRVFSFKKKQEDKNEEKK
ncbi:MAG: hypothetical protein ACP5OG_05615 [Candidatus Nanoarchaeia archaeon]